MTEDHGQLAVADGSFSSTGDKSTFLRDHTLCDSILSWADAHRWALFATVFAFYLGAFNGQWRVQPDAALYLSIGRNLARGLGYTYLGQPNFLAYPGWPTLIAISFRLFGMHTLIPAQVLMLLISLATLAMCYRLFLLHSGRPTAVVVTTGVGLTKAFFCYGFELWSDMPFALGVMAVLAGYEGIISKRDRQKATGPRKLDWFFLIVGVLFAASMRPTIWPLLVALALAITVRAIKREIQLRTFLLLVGLPALLVAAACIYSWIHSSGHAFGGDYEKFLLDRLRGRGANVRTHSIGQNIRDLFTWAASDVLFQARLGPYWNSILSLLVLFFGVGSFRYRALWGFWFCLLLCTIMVSQEALDRYFLPVLPILVFAWWDLLVRTNRALNLPWGNVAFICLLSFGCFANITKVCGIITQQRQTPFLASYDNGRFDSIPQFARQLHDNTSDRALVLSQIPYARVIAYLSQRYVIGWMGAPTDEMKTRRVFVVEPSDAETQNLLKAEGLIEGPAIFTVKPSKNHGPLANAWSLHATRAAE